MITPNKYTNIGLSVVGLGADILKLLAHDNYQKFNSVLAQVIQSKGSSAKENFKAAVCFLFMIGKVRYHPKDDILELVQDA